VGSNGNAAWLGPEVETGQHVQYRIPCRPVGCGVVPNTQEIQVHFAQPAAEHRQQLRPNPGTLVPRVGIGRIEPGIELCGPHVLLQLGAPKRKQRPNYASLLRSHSGQTGRTRTGQNPHQNRFDLVVGMVSSEDPVGAGPSPGILQPGVAMFSGFGFRSPGP
jgi:hypothetical protein